jgi:hypothetical protein
VDVYGCRDQMLGRGRVKDIDLASIKAINRPHDGDAVAPSYDPRLDAGVTPRCPQRHLGQYPQTTAGIAHHVGYFWPHFHAGNNTPAPAPVRELAEWRQEYRERCKLSVPVVQLE